jgi:hypothetical protein
VLAAGLAISPAPVAAYFGDTYCNDLWLEHNQGCSVGESDNGNWTIAQNKGQDKSGEEVCIDIYDYTDHNDHSEYNCKHKYEYAFEEPYAYDGDGAPRRRTEYGIVILASYQVSR